MKTSYDVLVVGAGPAGSTAAEHLAAQGIEVAVLEEHAVVGEPVDCTGVVGTEAFETFDLPRSIILGSVNGVTIHSPAGIPATYQATEPLAHVVDRAELDRCLATRARQAGATFLLSTQAVDVTRDARGIEVTCRCTAGEPRRLSAKMLILAGGPRFAFHGRLGLGTSSILWRSAHAELPGNSLSHAQVYLGRDVAPGAFGWAVPVNRSGIPHVRIGVNSHSDAPRYLRKLCEEKFPHLMPDEGPLSFRSWVVPVLPLSRTYADRALAVGDAAGQVKPTSGGGIYYGMLSAREAADTVAEAFKRGTFTRDALSTYEKRWRAHLGLDLKIGTLFRRLFARMADRDVDDLFHTLHTDGLLARMTEKISFDWHRELILFLLKHPKLARILMRRCLDWRAEPAFSDLPAL
ncbi:MAG: NAD(P)/FAD-dependent oxidoreductase [candidate division NC10 bacterium]|nr:NAD(P)/FAD-dependent oxidoreductase [candidate division NC10 bacterium]